MLFDSRRVTRLDLHLHTPSSDGFGSPKDYVSAIRRAGLDGIVITDHHITSGLGAGDVKVGRGVPSSVAVEKAVKAAGFVCLRGCEYSSAQGHILVYGVDIDSLYLGKWADMQEVIWRTLDAGGIAFPSHPFQGHSRTLGARVYGLDGLVALEGYNGQCQVRDQASDPDARARQAAEDLGLPYIGTSDAHIAYRVGTCYTEFDGSIRCEQDLIEALRGGAYRRSGQAVHAALAQAGGRGSAQAAICLIPKLLCDAV